MPVPEDDLQLLLRAADAAGHEALRFWRRAPRSWEKAGDAGPVSEADLAVDAALRHHLARQRPDYGWLSEETPDDLARLGREQVFVVDPIDGTRSFLEGEASFAISLAVITAGRVTAAVVHLPARHLTYAAHEGGPAMRNGELIQASRRAALAGAEVLTTRASLSPADWPGGVPEVRRNYRPSLAWRLCLAAEGRFDAMLTLRDTWEWDGAAGALIAERAGCAVSDRHGAALCFNRPLPKLAGIVAAPPALSEQMMAGLGEAGAGRAAAGLSLPGHPRRGRDPAG